MCGRFALATLPHAFREAFGCDPPEGLGESWNVTPDRPIPIVRVAADGAREAVPARWGLLGPWMKDAGDPARQINARCESAADKPMFRDSFKKGRCLIPATGFYEWQKAHGGPSRPYFVRLGTGSPFAFAGLWRRNRLADGSLLDSCAILTTEASPALRPIHHRMPVILSPAGHSAWLDPAITEPERLRALLVPIADLELAAWQVGRAVNNPRNDGPDLAAPAAADPPTRQASLI
jgi:putative SOS response-associated peptidase YedK